MYLFAPAQLLLGRRRRKVYRIPSRSLRPFRAGRRPEVTVTSRLRELIQQLGEAIHESVIESEQIAGVVQDIRKQGFDVLLMLEATIGLNEVSAKEIEDEERLADEGTFTQNDVNFLKSLRISVASNGEDDEDA